MIVPSSMRRMLPNLLTASRLVLAPFLVMVLWHSGRSGEGRGVAFALFLWIAASDGLDGWLARRWNAQTALGRALDPAADKLVALLSFLTLVWVGHKWHHYYALPFWLAAVVIVKDLWIVIGYLVARLMDLPLAIRPNRWGKAATFCQFALVLTVLLGGELDRVGLGLVRPALVWVVTGVTAMAALSYTWDSLWRASAIQIVRG